MSASERASAVEALLVAEELDAAVVGVPANVLWLSGFDMVGTFYFTAVVVAPGSAPALLVHRAEADMARSGSHLADIALWGHGQDHVDALGASLEERLGSLEGRRVGVELDGWLRVHDLDEVERRLGLTWVDIGPQLERLGAQRSPDERRLLEDAARIADMTIATAGAVVSVGAQERGIAAEAQFAYASSGGQEQPVPLSVRSGPRLALSRALPSGRSLGTDDAVAVEVWASRRRCCAMSASTWVLGRPGRSRLKAWSTVEAIFDLCDELPETRAPLLAREVDELARRRGVQLLGRTVHGLSLAYPLRPATPWPRRGAPREGETLSVLVRAGSGADDSVVAARTYRVQDGHLVGLTHRPRLTVAS